MHEKQIVLFDDSGVMLKLPSFPVSTPFEVPDSMTATPLKRIPFRICNFAFDCFCLGKGCSGKAQERHNAQDCDFQTCFKHSFSDYCWTKLVVEGKIRWTNNSFFLDFHHSAPVSTVLETSRTIS